MSTPLVSAIMPTYNQEAFVGAAIESAVMQDYSAIQLVVSDDGSTDGTVDIIESWAQRYPDRVTAIVGEPHLGVTGNCNRALARCRGELRAFHAGDDIWLPGKIARQVEWMKEHPDHVLCGHDVEVFDSATDAPMYLWSEIQPLRAGDTQAGFVRDGNLFHPLGNMVRARALPAGGYDPRLPLCSDWKLFVDCLAREPRFGFIEGVHARYRQWPGNVSKREAAMRHDLLLTLEILSSQYPALRSACAERRSTLLYHFGVSAIARGELPEARRLLREAGSLRPSWRVALARAAASLPAPFIASIRRSRSLLRGSNRRSQ